MVKIITMLLAEIVFLLCAAVAAVFGIIAFTMGSEYIVTGILIMAFAPPFIALAWQFAKMIKAVMG